METNAKILIADENSQSRHATKESLIRKGFIIHIDAPAFVASINTF